MNSLYLVVGLGKTGLSIARYLTRKCKPFAVFDTRAEPPGLAELKAQFPKTPVYLEQFPEELIPQLCDIIVSPGIPLDAAYFEKAKQAGVAMYGDIECLAREITAPLVAITGTNGKSTVTTLVGEMAKAAGLRAAVAGNIGTPVLDRLNDGTPCDLWVLELSSFQLELTDALRPAVATILNITPDHLDRHHTVAAYIQAKQRIYDNAQLALFNKEDDATLPVQAPCASISFGQEEPATGHWGLTSQAGRTFLAKGNQALLPVDALLIKGVHNWLNALAAAALADAVGIGWPAITEVLRGFKGLAHRCQWVRTLDGVEWINDSKGTNVGATLSAIDGIGASQAGKIVLIAGGQGKGADFKTMRQPVANFVRAVILIGEDAALMDAALHKTVPLVHAPSLEAAVISAKTHAVPGDVVLLSPACASLDMFKDFNHRGEVFINAVNGL